MVLLHKSHDVLRHAFTWHTHECTTLYLAMLRSFVLTCSIHDYSTTRNSVIKVWPNEYHRYLFWRPETSAKMTSHVRLRRQEFHCADNLRSDKGHRRSDYAGSMDTEFRAVYRRRDVDMAVKLEHSSHAYLSPNPHDLEIVWC